MRTDPSPSTPTLPLWLCCFMADPKRKPRQSDVDRDTGERRRQEEALDEALKNTFQHPIRF